MPRRERQKEPFCTYHIIQRGNEKKKIFLGDADKIKFMEILSRMKRRYNYFIYAYCLMDNHVHLIINDNGNDISQIMKSINISYASYFNRSYKRCGHLFQDRFKSEMVKDDDYLLELSKYIHNNPVKAKIVEHAADYSWSSYNIYAGQAKDMYDLVDKDFILSLFSELRSKAIAEYIHYVNQNQKTDLEIMDVEDDFLGDVRQNYNYIVTLEEAGKKIKEKAESMNISYADLMNDKELRNKFIKYIRENSSLTLKQIGELFGGISESRISRILSRK